MSLSRNLGMIVLAGIVLTIPVPAFGQTTWHVDDDNCPGPGSGTPADPFCEIQDGIDASTNGDEVLVAPGSYNEVINFNGKVIVLRSSDGPEVTTIDATALGTSVVTCANGSRRLHHHRRDGNG